MSSTATPPFHAMSVAELQHTWETGFQEKLRPLDGDTRDAIVGYFDPLIAAITNDGTAGDAMTPTQYNQTRTALEVKISRLDTAVRGWVLAFYDALVARVTGDTTTGDDPPV